ncbi:hypothetical protein NY78_3223 [Desulfovibrio sp. TomC]|nr:hypothetical protein NY78_3223 [Desulfovibrio sp. TomC]
MPGYANGREISRKKFEPNRDRNNAHPGQADTRQDRSHNASIHVSGRLRVLQRRGPI